MATITVKNSDGEIREIGLVPGLSLMELLRDEGYDEILAMCGGCCSCATCHVHVESAPQGSLPPVEEDEEMLIMMADNYAADKSRLSCQIELQEQHDGMVINILEPE